MTGNDSIARILGNCVYAGLIKVPGNEKLSERHVNGLHEPIIPEAQYWLVQEMLQANKRAEQPQPKEEFPLRGLLKSPCCGGNMTAGWSKGRRKRYLYYRCIRHSNVNISGKMLHEKYGALVKHLDFAQEDLDFIIANVEEKMRKDLDLMKKQVTIKAGQLAAVEKQIDRLEERMINEELEASTYKKYFRKFKMESARLKEEITYLEQGSEDEYNQQLLLLPYLVNLAAIFEQVPVTEQHSIMRDVFKHGLTFRESAFRTPWINPMLEHNLQILKEKGLLFLEQPSDDLDGLPSGRGGGIRTHGLFVPNEARYRAALHPDRAGYAAAKISFLFEKAKT